MRMIKLVLITAVVMSMTGMASASSIVAKFWYADATVFEDPAMLYGANASVSLSENLWLSAMFLTGTYDAILADVDTSDAEIILGYTTPVMDLGIGGRYTLWTVDDFDDDFNIFGPMAYIGFGNSFGDSPLGWYLGGSYMFKDLGDADNEDWEHTFEHYNIEGGLSLAIEALTATIGYRYKAFIDSDIDLDFRGVTASVGLGF